MGVAPRIIRTIADTLEKEPVAGKRIDMLYLVDSILQVCTVAIESIEPYQSKHLYTKFASITLQLFTLSCHIASVSSKGDFLLAHGKAVGSNLVLLMATQIQGIGILSMISATQHSSLAGRFRLN